MKKKIKLYKGIFLIKKKYNKKQFYYYLKVPNVAVMVPVLNKKFFSLVSLKFLGIFTFIYSKEKGSWSKKPNSAKNLKGLANL